MYARFYLTRLFIVFLVKNAVSRTQNVDEYVDEEETTSEDDEKNSSMFTEVVKNITKVNVILQDLIKNYDKLKRIYKSQEANEYSSSDFIHKTERRTKRKREKSVESEEKPKRHVSGFAKAAISPSELLDKEIKNNKLEEAKVPHLKVFKYVKTHKHTTRTEISIKSNESTEESNGETDNETKDLTTTESHSKFNTKTFTPIIRKNTQTIKTVGPKLIHNIEVDNAKDFQYFRNSKILSFKKIITNDKASCEPEKNKYQRTNVTLSKRNLTGAVISSENNNNNKGTSNQVAGKDTPLKEDTLEAADSDESGFKMRKEQFKTLVLRKAYGDACLKVVVRKCYKACCNIMKQGEYSEKFVKEFKGNAKKGCLKEFRPDPIEKAMNNQSDKTLRTDTLLDLGSNGYLIAACLPNYKAFKHEDEEGSTEKKEEEEVPENLNILRDRFEEACQKESRDKCVKACKFASKETCKTQECKRDADPIKSCSRECKAMFVYVDAREKDDSGDDSEDESEDDDSDDSDDDDDDDTSTTTHPPPAPTETTTKNPDPTTSNKPNERKKHTRESNHHKKDKKEHKKENKKESKKDHKKDDRNKDRNHDKKDRKTDKKKDKKKSKNNSLRQGWSHENIVKTWQKVDLNKLHSSESQGIDVRKDKYLPMQGRNDVGSEIASD